MRVHESVYHEQPSLTRVRIVSETVYLLVRICRVDEVLHHFGLWMRFRLALSLVSCGRKADSCKNM